MLNTKSTTTLFRVYINYLLMNKIVKKDGYVFLVKEDSNDGRFVTWYNLGKDSDDPRWKEEEEKPKKKTKQKKG